LFDFSNQISEKHKPKQYVAVEKFFMGWEAWDGMGWDGMGWDGMGWDGKLLINKTGMVSLKVNERNNSGKYSLSPRL